MVQEPAPVDREAAQAAGEVSGAQAQQAVAPVQGAVRDLAVDAARAAPAAPTDLEVASCNGAPKTKISLGF
ncbi:MAG: hypothetical protein ABSA96_17495 [Candidatus Acidiferrales bacterium]